MRLIKDIDNKYPTNKKAALYYKTEPFYTNVEAYVHTNNWEILQSIKILNQNGFSVDLIDRGNSDWTPTIPYDLFLGLGVGNAGRNFVRHATISQAPKKVLLSMGPQPDISNKLVLERYSAYNKRTGENAPPMRTVGPVTGEKFLEIMDSTDYIFNIGEKGTKSYTSFIPYNKPILNFYPSISPRVKFDEQWLHSRDLNSFLCFAGNGFICKGVDLVVESFLNNPTKQLHICGPKTEAAFFKYYGKKLAEAPNIKYHGFIQAGGPKFNQIAAKCSFVVFHSAAEGCCTSVATAIKAGLVPIINRWTGINIIDEGFVLSEEGNLIDNITITTDKAANITKEKYKSLVFKTLKKADLFSQDSFTASYAKAISHVIRDDK